MVETRLESGSDFVHPMLYYREEGKTAFVGVPMEPKGDLFQAAIPGMGRESRIEYYIQAQTEKGRSIVDPANAPWDSYSFYVSKDPILIGDDFQDTNPVNKFGNDAGVYGEDSGAAIAALQENGALCLQYDVTVEDSYGGYYSLMRGVDLTTYQVLHFKVKGGFGGEVAMIGLRDHEYNETQIVISQYLEQGITTQWQEVAIPLNAFTGVKAWDDMDNFNIDFSYAAGSWAGCLYVDDIQFKGGGNVPIHIDNFNLPEAKNGVGGNFWLWHDDAVQFISSYVQDADNQDNTTLQVDYRNIRPDACGVVVFDLSGLNAESHQYLSFRIKGGWGDEQPNIYLTSGDEDEKVRSYVDIETYGPLTSEWQRIQIPLAHFTVAGIDFSDLKNLEFAFEWEWIDSGTIYLDDIIFENAK